MNRNRLSDVLLALLPAAAAILLHGPLLDWGLKIGDEGYLVYGVERLAEGEVLYRDVLRHYMPGVYYIFVPLFDWFGPDLGIVRLVWLGWLAALCGGACLLLRPMVPPWIAVLAGLLTALVPPPSHKTFVPAMVLVGLACCRSLLRSPISFRRALGVGAALGVVALFRQEVAVFSLAVGAVTVGARALAAGRREGVAVAAAGVSVGFVTVWTPVLAAFAAAGALVPMFEQVVLTASAANAGMGLPFPAPSAGGAVFYFPAAMVALGAVIATIAASKHRFGETHALLLQWSALAALMHVLVLQRSDVPHLTQILLAPTLILVGSFGLCWESARDGGAPPSRRMPAALAASLLGAAILALGAWGLRTEILPDYEERRLGVPLDEERARVVLDPLLASEARQILDYLRERTRPGEPIFVAPYSPMYYFLADRPNPTRHDFVLPVTNSSPEVQREIRDDLDAAGVRVVLIRDVAIDGIEDRRFPRYTPWLADYFAIEFERDRRIGSWLCLLRREGR